MHVMSSLGMGPAVYCAMLREILRRALPLDVVLRFHELHKRTKTLVLIASTTDPDVSGHRLTAEKELQELFKFIGHQHQGQDAVAEPIEHLTLQKTSLLDVGTWCPQNSLQ